MYEDTLLSEEHAMLDEALGRLGSLCQVAAMDPTGLSVLASLLKNFKLLRGAQTLTLVEGHFLLRNTQKTAFGVVVMSQSLAGHGSQGQLHRNTIREPYQLVVGNLPQNLGRVMIRPNRMGDRLGGLFARRQITFREHPDLNRKYHITCEDEELTRSVCRWGVLDVLSAFDGLLIEILGHAVMVMRGRSLNVVDSLDIAQASFGILGAVR